MQYLKPEFPEGVAQKQSVTKLAMGMSAKSDSFILFGDQCSIQPLLTQLCMTMSMATDEVPRKN